MKVSFPSTVFALLLLACALPVWGAHAQNSDSTRVAPISTYRPSASIGAGVLPKGTVQAEVGVRYNRDTPGNARVTAHAYPNLLVRVGVLERLELQLSGVVQDSVVQEPQGRRKVQGVGPVGVGVAVSLLDGRRGLPALALNASLSLPIGDSRLAPAHAEPAVLLAASTSLLNHLGILVNAGYSWSGGTPVSHLVLNLNSGLVGPFALYVGAASDKARGEQTAYRADAGLLWRALPNLQFDVAAGKQLNHLATDYFFAAGVSFRLPH